MALSKVQSESINLADNFAFTGTVTGAGEPAGLKLLNTVTLSNNNEVRYTNSLITSTYDWYRIFFNFTPVSNAKLYMRFFRGSDNTLITGNDFAYENRLGGDSNGAGFVSVSGDTIINTDGYGCQGNITVGNVNIANMSGASYVAAFRNTTPQHGTNHGQGGWDAAAPNTISGIQLYLSTGNFQDGKFYLYGVTK
tara:strand:+ start:552 stop:1136 length:585 start_codon:yes stop_codon:yes gene_type:complete